MNNQKKKPSESDRFEEVARRVGADETGARFERSFKKIVPPQKSKLQPKKKKGATDDDR